MNSKSKKPFVHLSKEGFKTTKNYLPASENSIKLYFKEMIDMKIMGLIGGMSWESTQEYYRIINEAAKNSLGGLHSCKSLMYSVDFYEIEKLQHQGKWEQLTDMMVEAAERLKRGGADFIVICTNTMHKMADDIEKRTGLKVLHIAEAAGEKVASEKLKTVGLLGTKFTMEEDFYKKVLKDRFDIDTIIPDDRERDIIHRVIYDELCKGKINQDSKKAYIDIINNLKAHGAEGVVLGCTEIPLLIKQKDVSIPVFDTTALHAEAAVRFALE